MNYFKIDYLEIAIPILVIICMVIAGLATILINMKKENVYDTY